MMISMRPLTAYYTVFLSGLVAWWALTTGAVAQEQPYMEVKLAAPATLSANVMRVARQIRPGPETEFLPLLLLGLAGYPSFPDFDGRESISFFIFASPVGEDSNWIGAVKVRAGSSVDHFLRANYPSGVREHGGWLWFTPKSSLLVQVTTLEPRAQLRIDDDVSIRMYPQRLPAVGGTGAQQNVGQDARVREWIHTGLQQLETVTTGLRLSRHSIGLVTEAVPLADSQLAEQLQLELPPVDKGAQWLSADRALLYQYRFPQQTLQLGWKTVRSQLLAIGEADPLTESVVTTLDEYIGGLAGTGAVASDVGGGLTDAEQVQGGTVSYQQLQSVATLGGDVVQQWLARFGGLIGAEDTPLEEGEVEGVRYFKVERNVSRRYLELDRTQLAGKQLSALLFEYALGQQDASFWPDMLQQGKVVEEKAGVAQYRAVVDGNVLSATRLDRLTDMIAAARGNQRVGDSIAETVPLGDRSALALQLHLDRLSMTGSRGGIISGSESQQLIDAFRQRDLEPVTAVLIWDPRGLRGEMTLPVQSLAAYLRLRSDLRQTAEWTLPAAAKENQSLRLPLPVGL